ncbi:unnamed protein product [Withania somnifera]
MSEANEFAAVTKAFSGLGVDEKLFISSLARWNRYQRESYRVSNSGFFKEDQRQFQRWDDHHILQLRQEFLRLKDAVVLYTMHPWERDARLFKEALLLKVPQHDVLIETACTRSSEDLLGARKAYHSLFESSVEEDIAQHIKGHQKKLLVALVSSYRYEGPKLNEDLAKSEAKVFANSLKDAKKKNLIEDEEIVRILSIRSKLHLKAIYNHYKEMTGNFLDEDLAGDLILKQVVQCLCAPQTYFSNILISSLRLDVEESAKDSVTRVLVTRADDNDRKLIKDEFHSKYGTTLAAKIAQVANGSYRDFLLTIIAKSD